MSSHSQTAAMQEEKDNTPDIAPNNGKNMGRSFYDEHHDHNDEGQDTVGQRIGTDLYSEHGHKLSHVHPMAKHSGTSVATFFNGLFTTIIGIATLGASVTFSYVLSNNTQQPLSANPTFSMEQIQTFLAISWLLFLLALAVASLGSTLLTFFKKHWVADWNGTNGRTSQWSVQMYASVISGIMGGLVIGAFILLGLVVVAYSPIVGWIAVGFTSFFGLIIVISVINQAPWPWRDNTPQLPRQQTV